MKLIDKIIAGTMITGIVLVYFATDFSFEMYTRHSSRNYSIGIYLISLLLTCYYGIRYIRPKKISFYFGLLVSSALLWVCLLVTGEKFNLLYHAVTGTTTPTALSIERVEKDTHKGSLTGSKVFIRYEGMLLKFESSRTNYFALKDKREIRAELGRAGDQNYYISKIYWQEGERNNARNAYWKYWVNKYWKVPVVIIGIFLFFLLLEWLRKKKIIPARAQPKVRTAKDTGFLFLKIMGVIALLFLLLYLAGLLYMFVRYGRLH